mmetsp:Transcript_15756/g.37413  ORF Transcript_15756/g.37413 Transcript_15756/m.37413 type:complete len:257 (+) Transcript_15756:268-1038(+)
MAIQFEICTARCKASSRRCAPNSRRRRARAIRTGALSRCITPSNSPSATAMPSRHLRRCSRPWPRCSRAFTRSSTPRRNTPMRSARSYASTRTRSRTSRSALTARRPAPMPTGASDWRGCGGRYATPMRTRLLATRSFATCCATRRPPPRPLSHRPRRRLAQCSRSSARCSPQALLRTRTAARRRPSTSPLRRRAPSATRRRRVRARSGGSSLSPSGRRRTNPVWRIAAARRPLCTATTASACGSTCRAPRSGSQK